MAWLRKQSPALRPPAEKILLAISIALLFALLVQPPKTASHSGLTVIMKEDQKFADAVPCDGWRRNPDGSITLTAIVKLADDGKGEVLGFTSPVATPYDVENIAPVIKRCSNSWK